MNPQNEPTTNESVPSSRKKKPELQPKVEPKDHRPTDEDNVLNMIEGVESQLGALRKAHEDHRKLMNELNVQKREVEAQTNEIESRESELTTREVELAEMRQEFETREMNLVQRAGGLEQRESKIATRAELLEGQEADLETKDQLLESKINELDSQLAGLSKRKFELDELETLAREKLAVEDQAKAKLEIATKELGESGLAIGEINNKLESVNDEFAVYRKEHETSLGQLKAAQQKLESSDSSIQASKAEIEAAVDKAEQLELELSQAREQYQSTLDESLGKLQGEQGESAELRSQLQSLETQLSAIGSESADSIKKLSSDLQDSQAHAKELAAQVNEIAGSADEELTAQRAKASELESQIASYSQQVEQAKVQISQLQDQLDAKPEIEPAELESLRAQLQESQGLAGAADTELDQARQNVIALESELKAQSGTHDQALAQSQEQALAQIEELESKVSSMGEIITKLTDELNGAQVELKDAQVELKGAQSAPGFEVDKWNTDRRARLAKMRGVLRGDAQKIRMATDALRSRYEQCEQLLAKRSELAQAYEVISSAQRKYQTREVRSGMFLGLFVFAAITMVLSVSSWFVSGRVTPGMYAAKVTMAAASGDTTISEADMANWETYITQLAVDPRFIEVAADRMQRRGIAEFGIAGKLSDEMGQSLDIISAMPGTVVMEYRGLGAQRTERVLDTFAVALSSAANNARARRADSSLTIIESPAAAGDEPLDNRRIEMAGMILGGTMLLTILFGAIVWKRLSMAKAKFEDDSRVDGLFEESKWQMPGE